MRARAGIDAGATIAFSIPADHPALPGHFPGAPVVPGALLLAEGLQRLEAALGTSVDWRRMGCAKFLRPVAAGDTVTATLTRKGESPGRVDFSVAGESVAEVSFMPEPANGTARRE